jgi:hypothetical protein
MSAFRRPRSLFGILRKNEQFILKEQQARQKCMGNAHIDFLRKPGRRWEEMYLSQRDNKLGSDRDPSNSRQ